MRRIVIVLFLFSFALCSCTELITEEEEGTTYSGWLGKKLGFGIIQGWRDGLACQGCAIKDDVIYVARSGGQCDRYALDGDEIEYLSSFVFQSGSSTNHANCIQFDNTITDSSIVYISTHYREEPCFVELVLENSSKLLQTIKVEEMDEVPNEMFFNLVAGDDGYLWLCGFVNTSLRVIKFKKPDLLVRDIILTRDDILDIWERNDYDWEQEVLQGMKMHNGKLYVVYGGSNYRRGLWIWDTDTLEFSQNVDFTNEITVEFEDVELYKEHLYLFVLDDYVIRYEL